MTKEELAKQLDGLDYPGGMSRPEKDAAKKAGLVVLYGGSDDLAEFEGAIDDEIGAYGGRKILVLPNGQILESEHECECKFCGYSEAKLAAKEIKAIWNRGGISWQYETEIPHAIFKIMEDGQVYCIGIVFELAALR